MANSGLVLFVACAVINSMCNAQKTDVGRLNTKMKKLNRKTDFIQKEVEDIWKEVDDIWAEVSEPRTVAQNYNNITRTDILGNINSQNFKTNKNETVTTVQDLKAEVENLVLTARDGFKTEKRWQRETLSNLTGLFENFQNNVKAGNIEVKHQLKRLKNGINDKLETINIEFNERKIETGNELQHVNKILENLRANQHKLQTENLALRQAILEMQTELTKVKDTLTCDGDWKRFNGHCYLFVKQKKSWDGASAYCENRESYLMEITTDAELEFAYKYVRDYSYGFWIGATDRDREGTFVYEHSKQQIPKKYWSQGEPDNTGDEHCVSMWLENDLELWDAPCSRRRYVVCEKP